MARNKAPPIRRLHPFGRRVNKARALTFPVALAPYITSMLPFPKSWKPDPTRTRRRGHNDWLRRRWRADDDLR